MLRNTIRLVIILAITSIIGIIFIQFFWVKRAFDMNEKQFNQTVTIALTTVADRLLMRIY
jgi:two-component system phosphate regulon sensor histidine kinase PhoR